MHDGPGVRTTVFFKGCPLRCAWCHNPEAQSAKNELLFYESKCIGCGACISSCVSGARIANTLAIDRESCIACGACASLCPTEASTVIGEDMSIEEILSILEKDRAFYGESGGVTLSGGEPFAQGEAVIALLYACKKAGFSTAVETCGYADTELFRRAAPFVDLFLWDIKDTCETRHKEYTGVTLRRIHENLSSVAALHARIRLRCILINGINTEKAHYTEIAKIAKTIPNLDGVELIPYHAYAGSKAVLLGRKDNGNKDWIPNEAALGKAREILLQNGIRIYG